MQLRITKSVQMPRYSGDGRGSTVSIIGVTRTKDGNHYCHR
jgi:hypothetical protein